MKYKKDDLFKDLKTGEIIPEIDIFQKLELLKNHIEQEISLRGEIVAMQFVRKFYPYYIRGIRDAAIYRGALVKELSYKKVLEILNIIQEKELQIING